MLTGKNRPALERATDGAGGDRRAAADENAVETAARALRRMIFDGEFRAGQPLRQEDLALRLGTSRHPVREALGRLSGEGLVNFRPRYGYTVRALGPDEINEIFEMRMVLEEHAGYVATLRRDERAIAEVEAVMRRMTDMVEKKDRNIRRWCDCNREFHVRLFAASGRGHLCRMIEMLRDSMETYIRTSYPDVGLKQIHAEHQQIFAAFRDGDAIYVARLCRQHVRHTAHSLIERLRSVQGSDAGGAEAPRPGARKRKANGAKPANPGRNGASSRRKRR